MSHTVRTIFFTLFFVIITILVLSAWMLFLYPSAGHMIQSSVETNSAATFKVTTKSSEIEKVVNKYLHDHIESNGLTFLVSLDDDLKFQGDIRMLGLKVPLTIGFDPVVQENGDLVLKQQYFQVGAISIPAPIVLEYLKRSYTFPDWIVFQPIQKKIYLSTTNMGSYSGVHIHAQKFDLGKDEFAFEVFLPGEAISH